MPPNRGFDPSPLASQICGGRYRQMDQRSTRRARGLPDWGVVYVLKGTARYLVPAATAAPIIARPGMVLLTPPGLPTEWDIPAKFCDHLWLHFLPRQHWLEWLDWPAEPGGVRTLFVPPGPARRRIIRAFQRVVEFTMAPESDRELFALNALEELLLWCQRLQPRPDAPRADPQIQLCLDHISQNLAQVITLADLAKCSDQSVSRLTHRFRQQTGLSPMQYLEQRRLARAMELLTRTSMRVQEIAKATGFESPYYFSLRFRKHTGYSPRAFRAKTSHPTAILRRPGLDLNPSDRQALRDTTPP